MNGTVIRGAVAMVGVLATIALGVAVRSYYQYRQDAQHFEQVRRQTSVRVAAAFEKMGIYGGSVIAGRTETGEPWFSSYIQATGDDIDDTDLAHLECLADAGLEGLTLSEANITDDGLKSLRNLNDLKYLKIDGTHVFGRRDGVSRSVETAFLFGREPHTCFSGIGSCSG